MGRTISVEHLTRVEGHGRINVEISGDRITRCEFGLFEGSRFFEALVLGRAYDAVPQLVCRICAICSAGHMVTPILALEKALGVRPTRQTELLRELFYHGMFTESHVLHAYFLALPDFLGKASVAELVPTHAAEVDRALKLKKLANTIQEVCGGRAIHSCNAVIGGFGKVPSRETLLALKEEIERHMPDAEAMLRLFASVKPPELLAEPTDYWTVKPDGDQFGYFGDTLVSMSGKEIPVEQYRDYVCVEAVQDYTRAKQSLPGGKPFMTGSLARVNILYDRLSPKIRGIVEEAGVKFPTYNTLYNNLAQAMETYYSYARAIEVIGELLALGPACEPPVPVTVRAGHGVAATEVPRGTLYHEYELDDRGYVTFANIVTPTAQNQANTEKDFRECLRNNLDKDDDTLRQYLEMIARAYDPCISCAVHLVDMTRRR